jgi:hypothetical protein
MGADWDWIGRFHGSSFICDHLRNLRTVASLYSCDLVRSNLAEAVAQFLHESCKKGVAKIGCLTAISRQSANRRTRVLAEFFGEEYIAIDEQFVTADC